jgi:medium-chain acyl-[acyl-carrier-protein] hydrolase
MHETLSRERCETAFSIASYEADSSRFLSLFALFNRFQDLAGIHAEHLQVGYDLLRRTNLAWILSRITIDILHLPKWGDEVLLATWPKGINRLFALREFSLTDRDGIPLVVASSAWLLVDVEKGRPQRVETLPIDLRFPGAPHAIEQTPDKIPLPLSMAPAFERQVWPSDIDTNQHVNNAQYAKWVEDCLAGEEFKGRRIGSLQINYLDETKRGDTVELSMTAGGIDGGKTAVRGRSRTTGADVFHALATWKPE